MTTCPDGYSPRQCAYECGPRHQDNPMIATVTKKFVTVGDLQLTRGMEVEVYNDRGSTLQVQYRDPDGNLHVAYNVQRRWFDNLVVYRRAVDLGL